MFKIRSNTRVPNAKVALIKSDYQDLLYYDQPILFCGVDLNYTPVLGSYVTEDAKKGVTRYLHTVMPWSLFEQYLARQLSYRDILTVAEFKYFVDIPFDGGPTTAYAIEFSDIPARFTPSEDSYCPLEHHEVPEGYELHLTGGLADRHLLKTRDQNELNNVAKQLLLGPLQDALLLKPELYSEPSAKGSFTLNLEIHLGLIEQSLFIDEESYRAFLSDYLAYCFTALFNDVRKATSRYELDSAEFNVLFKTYELIASHVGLQLEGLRNRLIDTLLKTIFHIKDFAALAGESFRSASLSPRGGNAQSVVGAITSGNATLIEMAAKDAERLLEDVSYEDTKITTYQILVYSLNVDSRSGRAFTQTGVGSTVHRPRIHIKGSIPLEGSDFTHSLDAGQQITVRGIGRYVQNRLVRLDLEGPPGML